MALTKEILLDNGVYMENAYIRILNITNINGSRADIKVDIYMNKAISDDDKPSVVQFTHICSTEYLTFFAYDVLNQAGVNIISQGYEYLKTLPFYEDAEDVMDVKE